MLSRLAAVAFFGLVLASSTPPAGSIPGPVDGAIHDVTAAELRGHVEVLAGDGFAGRGVGHAGNQQAEQYIANAFRAAGVPPAALDYLQPVQVYQPQLGRGGRLIIASQGKPPIADLTLGSDFYPLPPSSDRPARGPLVFAGYGISAPRLKHDDYAHVNARGAMVLVLDGAPGSWTFSGQPHDIAGLDRKVADARAHGAAGLIVVRSYLGDAAAIWPEQSSIRSASYSLFEPMRAAPLAVAAISEQAARPLRRALDSHQPLTAALDPDVIAKPIVMDNVLGLIEGRSPAADMVVVGAHLDHDGLDEAGRIYNGADDNASGTAAVLAMAAAFARAAAQGARPARAVVFALWNGEEKGSLGAESYVAAPIPTRRIVANVNLDMVGREEEIPDPVDPRFSGFQRTTAAESMNVVHLLGYTYSPDLARIVERANATIRLTIKQDYDRDAQGLLYRSDNWPFLQHGVPAVFLTTGLHPDYHTPDDDTERIDFAKLERITELASRAVWMAADGPAPRFQTK